MELCCTYIEINKFMEVISFYEKILQIKPNIYTENRWVEFECGNKLAIYNRKFDEEKINSRNNVNYNDAYIKDFNKEQNIKMNFEFLYRRFKYRILKNKSIKYWRNFGYNVC